MPSPRRSQFLEAFEGAGNARQVQPSASHDETSPASPKSIKHGRAPKHPIPCMQAAFEESIMEYTEEAFGYVREKLSAHARRQQLLEKEDFGAEYSARWRRKPGAKFHPLWKLIAQIAFGVHLLQRRTAKSDHEVVKILQTHVDEIDSFLEDTMVDFDLATSDIEERIEYLIMPLHNGRTFEKMLADRVFRNAILDGNDVIERIITRTECAMNIALDDVAKGLEGTAELAKYLDRLGSEWTRDKEDLQAIYSAMRANAEGWYACFKSIQLKGEHLRLQCSVLDSTVSEVARRCGMVSRRGQSSRVRKDPRQTSDDKTKTPRAASRMPSFDKPLPPDPLTKALAARVSNHALESNRRVSQTTSPSSSPCISKVESPTFSSSPSAATSPTFLTQRPSRPLKPLNLKISKEAIVTPQSTSHLSPDVASRTIQIHPGSRRITQTDSAYSSCSSSIPTSPRIKMETAPFSATSVTAYKQRISPPLSPLRNSTMSKIPTSALPQNSKPEVREEQNTKSGLGSLKVLFTKKPAVKERSPNRSALGGHTEF